MAFDQVTTDFKPKIQEILYWCDGPVGELPRKLDVGLKIEKQVIIIFCSNYLPNLIWDDMTQTDTEAFDSRFNMVNLYELIKI